MSILTQIDKLTAVVCRSHPDLDPDEVRSEAGIALTEAIQKYDPTRNDKPEAWNWFYGNGYFYSRLRRKKFRNRLARKVGQSVIFDHPHKKEWHLSNLLAEVSEQAAMAIGLALCLGSRKQTILCLKEEFGWEKDLINRVWEEVREILS